MTLTASLRKSIEPFELQVVNELLRKPDMTGYVANNVLLPNVSFRCYPDEHDALLLLPWAGYTLDAKNWHGEFHFPGNNPVEWRKARPETFGCDGDWHPVNLPNPFHVGKQKCGILHSYCCELRIGLDKYPIYPLIVLPDGTTFTPERHEYHPADGRGPRLFIRIVNLSQLHAQLREDARKARTIYSLEALGRLLEALEGKPKHAVQGQSLSGFRLQERVERAEPGCPVPFVSYRATQEFTGLPAEVRLYQNWPRSQETARFLGHTRKRAIALQRSKTPTVLRCHPPVEFPDQLQLAFEWFEGKTLRSVLDRRGSLEARLVRSLLAHLTRTVQSLHEEGVVHHDIRPEYVLVAPNLDDHLGANHRLVGFTNPLIDDGALTTAVFADNFDASFSSVEMRTHRHPDRGKPSTDIFSLGRLGVYCLLGESKYREVVVSQPDEPLRFDLSGADSVLQRVLTRAMEYRPANRYASAGEIAHELET